MRRVRPGPARHLRRDGSGRRAVELAERYADGAAEPAELQELYRKLSAEAAGIGTPQWAAEWGAAVLLTDNDLTVAELALEYALYGPEREAAPAKPNVYRRSMRRAQAALVRDIFGNPFRPAPVDPSWLTATVRELARGIYEDRAFDRLPILADALEDAGCADPEVLGHCRGEGPNVRGCWVIDRLLGKE